MMWDGIHIHQNRNNNGCQAYLVAFTLGNLVPSRTTIYITQRSKRPHLASIFLCPNLAKRLQCRHCNLELKAQLALQVLILYSQAFWGSIAIHETVRFCIIVFSVYEYIYDVFFITLEEIERFRNDEQVT